MVEHMGSCADGPVSKLSHPSYRDTKPGVHSSLAQMPGSGSFCSGDICMYSLCYAHGGDICGDQLAPLDLYCTGQALASRRLWWSGRAHEADVAQHSHAFVGCSLAV